jgi:putative glutathione S-transferase
MTHMTVQAQFPEEQSSDGAYIRQPDAFREWVRADGSTEYPAEKGRYHLYVSYACPWSHRTIIVHKLKKLDKVIGMTIVDPIRDERGWAFTDRFPDPVNGFKFLSEAYQATDPGYQGRVTVPVLWDRKTNKIVSNSDDDLMRMFNSEFDEFTDSDVDLYPRPLRPRIDTMNKAIYDQVNNGVYKAGFSTSQQVYARAATALFSALDRLESRLARRRFLFGGWITETDWRLFVSLIRFDAVYHGHFKCNVRKISEYPNLFGYLRDLYQQPGIKETVKFDQIKRHYYITHDDINPTRIVPIGPDQNLMASCKERRGLS